MRRTRRFWATRSIGLLTVKLGPAAATVWGPWPWSVTWAAWTGRRKHTLWPLGRRHGCGGKEGA